MNFQEKTQKTSVVESFVTKSATLCRETSPMLFSWELYRSLQSRYSMLEHLWAVASAY